MIGNEKPNPSLKVVRSDEQRDDGLVELVEEIAGEATGGEDEDRNIMDELTKR